MDHWFWWLLVLACVVWYSSITLYIAYRGAKDIREMFKRLAAQRNQAFPGSRALREETNDQHT